MPAIINECARPRVQGKFIYVGDEKLYIRGVTYGTFGLDDDGNEQHNPEAVERDFAQMAANGLNALRTYTVPPRWLLDAALSYNLRVMVGLPWEQHIAFLDSARRAQSIEKQVREGVHACAGHAAVLCYAIGNEIPAPIVRWYGHRRIEHFLERLYRAAKAEDPGGLVTYVNYPSTEYLQLPFIDFLCFNVYLESQDRLEAYLARLHNIAGERPLLMAEIGLDSLRNGQDVQARVLDWQIRTAFSAGCAGLFVFAWTDTWFRGGYEIEDWDFGITDRNQQPKLALAAVRRAFAEVPCSPEMPSPRISVVVCSYNGHHTIRDCFDGLLNLKYPNFEVIVVNDGSTDETASIAHEYGFQVITTANCGLSNARNIGMEAATGEIVAYIDDNARPDPDWLSYLAATFLSTDFVGVGGPNIPPPGDGPIADCVANAPGGPIHVLLSDREAEHIPGCNMAFRKTCLKAIGGFDPQFRTAGDDVDVCWRLQQRGWKLGFSPAAVVWHHRRNSVHTYWKQQQGYGKAEALLERKWPEKYNAIGHLTWAGRLYGRGLTQMLGLYKQRIYHGTWGSALFQSIYQPAPGWLWSLTLMPEWYMVILVLIGLSVLGLLWSPLLLAEPLLALAIVALLIQAGLSAARASFPSGPQSFADSLQLRCLTALLHLLQPLARLLGRLNYGLTPWRWRGDAPLLLPRPRTTIIWNERWRSMFEVLESIQEAIHDVGGHVRRGGDFDRWDLEVRGGILGNVRTLMTVEEHGAGKQLVRFRTWPVCTSTGIALILLLIILSTSAGLGHVWIVSVILGVGALLLIIRLLEECAIAMATIQQFLTYPKVENKVLPNNVVFNEEPI